jgi:vacuolar-type H+-ATPase subunit E/Vma4
LDDLQRRIQETFADVEQRFHRDLRRIRDEVVQDALAKMATLKTSEEQTIEKERLQAELKLKALQLTELDTIVDTVLQNARAQIRHIRTTPTYTTALTQFLRQALDYAPNTDVVVQGSRDDAEILRRIADEVGRERNVTITVANEPLDDVGGIVVRSVDGAFAYISSIEGRIEELRPVLRHLVLKRLRE